MNAGSSAGAICVSASVDSESLRGNEDSRASPGRSCLSVGALAVAEALRCLSSSEEVCPKPSLGKWSILTPDDTELLVLLTLPASKVTGNLHSLHIVSRSHCGGKPGDD